MRERSLPLIAKLIGLAETWAAATGRSLSRLATKVANDGKLFDRLSSGGTCTVATLERFTMHLADPVNWPDRCVPDEARNLLATMGVDGIGEASCRCESIEHVSGNL